MFFLCGLWHGASWNFVIWGLWHGTFLVIERVIGAITQSTRISRELTDCCWSAARHAYTLLVVMIGWVFFRADTLPGAIAFLNAMAGLSDAGADAIYTRAVVSDARAVAHARGRRDRIDAVGAGAGATAGARRAAARSTWPVSLASTTALIALLVASIMPIAARTYNPFIYFRF